MKHVFDIRGGEVEVNHFILPEDLSGLEDPTELDLSTAVSVVFLVGTENTFLVLVWFRRIWRLFTAHSLLSHFQLSMIAYAH